MYQQHNERFGAYDKYSFYSSISNNLISLVPGCGAVLTNLVLNKKRLLDGYLQPGDMEKHSWSKSEFLVPFPNRLRDGQFTFEGKTYQFPINDVAGNNALHGLEAGMPMLLQEVELEKTHARCVCICRYDGAQAHFPFPFELKVTYVLHDPAALTIEMSVRNTGKGAMPMGIGWHPYFAFGGTADDWHLQLPPSERIEIDDRMIPTGERTAYRNFAELKRIGATSLDTCFALSEEGEGKASILLVNKDQSIQLRYWQEYGEHQFNYYQLFIPPQRQSLAIEPMTCNVDAFNNGDGLRVLQPGEALEGRFGVELSKKKMS